MIEYILYALFWLIGMGVAYMQIEVEVDRAALNPNWFTKTGYRRIRRVMIAIGWLYVIIATIVKFHEIKNREEPGL